MPDETFHKVTAEIAHLMGIPRETLKPETTLAEIGLDSLDGLQLLIELERVIQAEIEEEDLKRFTTIQSIVDIVNQRVRKATAA